MSWINKLYETYENCQSMIGVGSNEQDIPLLPICHTTQKAQIEIVINQEGEFRRARVLSKDEARTIIPCTESGGGRSGKKPDTHPLCDKLQYVAGDFHEYGGEVTSGYATNPKEPFEKYHELLKKWCESKFAHPKAQAVLKYIERGKTINDLVAHKILFTGANGKLLDTWDKNTDPDVPEIFKVSPNASQMDAFVRWSVEIPNDPQTAAWTDHGLFECWIKYYASTKETRALCYVSGEETAVALQHPAKLRNDGDKAKLISSNDNTGFTFRGRFSTAEQACGVGFEVTQKAHNALRWLIGKQGYRKGDLAVVAWATTGNEIPSFFADSYSMLEFDKLQNESETSVWTAQELALKLNKKIAGYHAVLDDNTDIVVLGLDSATPGRMAMTFYRELTGSDFLKRINDWHNTCFWLHNYWSKEIINPKTGKKERVHIRFVGAPAPNEITEAAYSHNVDEKLRKATIERIIPCIIDGQKIPRDLVESAVRRASNRANLELWEWNKTLSITCALYRKYRYDYMKEDFEMALDENCNSRDYLYGRLLALADSLEQWALNNAGENRQTTAARLMQRFADHPYTTWRTIELALGPYKARLGGQAINRLKKISEIITMFTPEEFKSDRKLSGEFLLGYHCQREALWKKEKEEEKQEEN